MIGLLVVSALSLVEPQGALAGLSLHLWTTKRTLLAGEPAKVHVTWTVDRPMKVGLEHVRLGITGPNGTVAEWREASFALPTDVVVASNLEPGAPRTTSHVLSAMGHMDAQGVLDLRLAFPVPGTYRIRAQYSDGRDEAASNSLTVSVRQPRGPDARVFSDLIRRKPWAVTPWLAVFEIPELALFFADHPRSPYLARPRLITWARQLERATMEAPDAPRGTPLGGSVPALLAEIAATPLAAPFDEDRQALLADAQRRSGWTDEALAAWRAHRQ